MKNKQWINNGNTIEATDATYEEIKGNFGEEIVNGVLELTKCLVQNRAKSALFKCQFEPS